MPNNQGPDQAKKSIKQTVSSGPSTSSHLKMFRIVPTRHHSIDWNALWSETYSTLKLQGKQSPRLLRAQFNEWMKESTMSSIPILYFFSYQRRPPSGSTLVCLHSPLRKGESIKHVCLFKTIWCQITNLKWPFPISFLARVSICGREPAGFVLGEGLFHFTKWSQRFSYCRKEREGVRFGTKRMREAFLCKPSFLWISLYEFSGWSQASLQSPQRLTPCLTLGREELGGHILSLPISISILSPHLFPPRWQSQAKQGSFHLSLLLLLPNRRPSSALEEGPRLGPTYISSHFD